MLFVPTRDVDVHGARSVLIYIMSIMRSVANVRSCTALECPGPLFGEAYVSSDLIDVWALGCMMIFMIGGLVPWEKASLNDPELRSFLINPFFLQTIIPISTRAQRLIRRILALDPSRRLSLREIRAEVIKMPTFFMTDREIAWASQDAKATAEYFKLKVDRSLYFKSGQQPAGSWASAETDSTAVSSGGLVTPSYAPPPAEPRTLADELAQALEATSIKDRDFDSALDESGPAYLPNTDILPCLGDELEIELLATPKPGATSSAEDWEESKYAESVKHSSESSSWCLV